jgi:hypothetical protein
MEPEARRQPACLGGDLRAVADNLRLPVGREQRHHVSADIARDGNQRDSGGETGGKVWLLRHRM